jgi:cyclic-di-GMP-binding protein
MATTFSFDIISDYNLAEMNNAIDQAMREMANRYDFKGTAANLAFLDSAKSGLTLTGDSQYQLDALLDVIRKKLAARGIDQRVLDTTKTPATSNLKTTLDVPFKKGLDQDKAKKITGIIREHFPKIKTQIQGSEVRVFSPKKDELQTIMQLLRTQPFDFPLEFTNYR